ncbi:FAD-dependent oxidoreductase [Nocardia sp. X0981]
MPDVDYCVIGGGFAGLSAALRLKQAGRSVALLEVTSSTPVDSRPVGGMLSHAPTGVLTQFGHALRERCGRIHWAGTESSAVMCGWVDGAVRSGERAGGEVLAHETMAVVGGEAADR